MNAAESCKTIPYSAKYLSRCRLCPVLHRAVLKAAERVFGLKQLASLWLCSQAAVSLQANRKVLMLSLKQRWPCTSSYWAALWARPRFTPSTG